MLIADWLKIVHPYLVHQTGVSPGIVTVVSKSQRTGSKPTNIFDFKLMFLMWGLQEVF